MKKQPTQTEQILWQAFVDAFRAYEKEPTAQNWIKQNRAHSEWANAFLKGAA